MTPVEPSFISHSGVSLRANKRLRTERAASPATWASLPGDIINRCAALAGPADAGNEVLFKLGRVSTALRKDEVVQAGTIGHLARKISAANFAAQYVKLLDKTVVLRDPVPFDAALFSVIQISQRVGQDDARTAWNAVYDHPAARDTEPRAAITLRALAAHLPSENSLALRYRIDRDARRLGTEPFAKHCIARAATLQLTDRDAAADAFGLLARVEELTAHSATASEMLNALSARIKEYCSPSNVAVEPAKVELFAATLLRVQDLKPSDRVMPQHLLLSAAAGQGDRALHVSLFREQLGLIKQLISDGVPISDAHVDQLAHELERISDHVGGAEDELWHEVMHVCEMQYVADGEKRRRGAHLTALAQFVYPSGGKKSIEHVRRLLRFADLPSVVQCKQNGRVIKKTLDHLYDTLSCDNSVHHADEVAAWDCITDQAFSTVLREHTPFSAAFWMLAVGDWSESERAPRYLRTYATLRSMPPNICYNAVLEILANICLVHDEDAVAVFSELGAIALPLAQSNRRFAGGIGKALTEAVEALPTDERPALTDHVAELMTRISQQAE